LADQDVAGSVELFTRLAGLFLGLEVACLNVSPLGFKNLKVGGIGPEGLVAGQEEVTGIAVLHGHNVPKDAAAFHAFEQNDFHGSLAPYFTT